MIVDREFIENNKDLTVSSVLNKIKDEDDWRAKKTVSDNGVKVDLRRIHEFDCEYSSKKILIEYSNDFIHAEEEKVTLEISDDFIRVENGSFDGSSDYYQMISYEVGDLVNLFEEWHLFFAHASKCTTPFPFSVFSNFNKHHNVISLNDNDSDKTLEKILEEGNSIKNIKGGYEKLSKQWFLKHNGEFIIIENSIYKITLTEDEIKNIDKVKNITLIQYVFFHLNAFYSIKRVKREVNAYFFYMSKISVLNKPFNFDVEESFDDLKYLICQITEEEI